MVVTTPTVTITKVERNSGSGYSEIFSNTTPRSNNWGDFLQITSPPDGVHDEYLVLHCVDDGGSAVWDTDDYRITFTLNAFSQTKGDTLYSKVFDENIIPTGQATWSSDTVTVEFTSGNLDGNPDNVQSISFVALLDGSEWEGVAGNDIVGFIVFVIDAMPTVTLTSMPASGTFSNDAILYDVSDTGDTVVVEPHHPNYKLARIYNNLGVKQGSDQTGTTFNITLFDEWYFVLHVDREFADSGTNIASRRIWMLEN